MEEKIGKERSRGRQWLSSDWVWDDMPGKKCHPWAESECRPPETPWPQENKQIDLMNTFTTTVVILKVKKWKVQKKEHFPKN